MCLWVITRVIELSKCCEEKREREREKECVWERACVCMWVCVWERERMKCKKIQVEEITFVLKGDTGSNMAAQKMPNHKTSNISLNRFQLHNFNTLLSFPPMYKRMWIYPSKWPLVPPIGWPSHSKHQHLYSDKTNCLRTTRLYTHFTTKCSGLSPKADSASYQPFYGMM